MVGDIVLALIIFFWVLPLLGTLVLWLLARVVMSGTPSQDPPVVRKKPAYGPIEKAEYEPIGAALKDFTKEELRDRLEQLGKVQRGLEELELKPSYRPMKRRQIGKVKRKVEEHEQEIERHLRNNLEENQ